MKRPPRMHSLALLAVLGGSGLGWWTVARLEHKAEADARLDTLAQSLQPWAASAERSGILRDAAQRRKASASAGPAQPFALRCPPPWQEVEPIGQGLWACRAPAPNAEGFYPNCNLTRSPVERGLTPPQYYAIATAASAQLSAATQRGGKSLRVHERDAYEACFDHTIGGSPLRVLATVFVLNAQAYALTCAVAPAQFAALEPRFREIAGSFELGLDH